MFVGFKNEHEAFTQEFGQVPFYPTANYLELAQVIAGSWLFVGNPSSPFWCAESLKHPVLLDVGKPRNWHFQRWGQLYGDDEWVLLPDLDNLERRYSRNVIGRAEGRTLLDQGRLLNIAQLALTCRDLEGDAAELGVYQGGCSAVIASTLPGKTLHLFDTFQGLPQDDLPGGHHKTGDFLTGQDKAAEYLAGYKTEYHVGVFPTTTTGMTDNTFCFVHVDGDLYQSTIDAIDYFWPRMVAGGVMVFDDWKWKNCPGVERAIRERDLNVTEGKLQCWVRKEASLG